MRFVWKRVAQLVIVLFFVTFFSYLLLSLQPGDPALVKCGLGCDSAAYEQTRELEQHERDIVGVTKYEDRDEELHIPLLTISPEQEARHLARLARVRAERDTAAHAAAMRRFEDEARAGDVNLMPAIIECVRAYATIGEMCGVLRTVYGEYREPLAV